jgi:MoxR-like ATPase
MVERAAFRRNPASRVDDEGPMLALQEDATVDVAAFDPLAIPSPCKPEALVVRTLAFGSRALAPDDELLLGSEPACSFRLADPTVSRNHCVIRHLGDRLRVTDVGSRNGTWFGGMRIAQAELPLPAVLVLGRVQVDVGALADEAPRLAPPLPALVGDSFAMRRLSAEARACARTSLPVLLRGQTGTGKELVARAIHDLGARARSPLVAINAATITRELAESELFGHVRGAFTGAATDRRGAFREAHGGTLLVDEIGSLPIEVQPKLLRVLEDGVVRPVGGEARSPVDVRLIAATCEPLERMVERGVFREDLYERIAVCVVRVPSLKDRPEDIPGLARHLLAASGLDVRLAQDALHYLSGLTFRGNVRELRNVVLAAAVRAEGVTITAADVARVHRERAGVVAVSPDVAAMMLHASGGNVSEAARKASMARSTFRDLLRKCEAAPRETALSRSARLPRGPGSPA